MKKLLRKIHRYFSKSSLRVISLLGITFALVVTATLAQQQQDIRQRAAGDPGGTGDTKINGYYGNSNNPAVCSPENGTSRTFVHRYAGSTFGPKLFECPFQSACKQIDADTIQCAATYGTDIKCGNSVCDASKQTCVLNHFDNSAVCVTKGSGPDGADCDNPNGTPNSEVCKSGMCGADLKCASSAVVTPSPSSGGSSSCIPTGTVPCGNACQYCDAGWTCGTDKQCYPPNTGGSTGGTAICTGSDFACNGKCYSCSNGGKCTNNNAFCNCPTGFVDGGSNVCCPTNAPKYCSDGYCRADCNPPTTTPDPRPSTFTLTTPNMDCNSAYLSWGTSTGATSYSIETYIDPSQAPIASLSKSNLPLNPTTYKVTGLAPSTIYYFGIVANGTGTLKRTLVVNGITTATCPTAGGGTTSTAKKTPTASTSNTVTTPVPPKTASPTITTTITSSPAITGSNSTANISLILTLPGIGSSSDSKNSNPARSTRTVNVGLVNSNGAITSSQGDVSFDSSSNSFKGTVNVPNLASGTYTVKVRLDNTLWKNLSSSITIVSGSNNPTTSTVRLVSGDLDQNNSLTIADYTNFVKCYKSLATCTDTLHTLSDLDDDGVVKDDLDDLTILQQGFNTQQQGD